MLRTLVVALALGAPGVAAADQFPQSAIHAPVVSDTGAVVGRVNAVERNARGEIVAVEIDGLEPPSAPLAARDLIAEDAHTVLMRERAGARREAGGGQVSLR